MTKKTIIIKARVSEYEYKQLEKLAAKLGLSISDIIRMGIDKLKEEHPDDEVPRYVEEEYINDRLIDTQVMSKQELEDVLIEDIGSEDDDEDELRAKANEIIKQIPKDGSRFQYKYFAGNNSKSVFRMATKKEIAERIECDENLKRLRANDIQFQMTVKSFKD